MLCGSRPTSLACSSSTVRSACRQPNFVFFSRTSCLTRTTRRDCLRTKLHLIVSCSTDRPNCTSNVHDSCAVSRRAAIVALTLASSCLARQTAQAFSPPPPGYTLYRDRLDGYSFLLPESWTPLSSSGNDVFFRNPYNVNENLFVSVSSPSSSKYSSIDDLKSPEAAAERTKQQYVQELMSTRLGVKRTADVLSSSERTASDGRKYYDLELEAKSFASRNQLAVSQRQIDAAMELEWDRRYVTVLGVANQRLYEFRLQTSTETYQDAKDTLLFIAQSFRCADLEA